MIPTVKGRTAARTRHVFVKHGRPRRQQSQNLAKYVSPTF